MPYSRTFPFLFLLLILAHSLSAQGISDVISPDGRIVVALDISEDLGFSVTVDGTVAVIASQIGVRISGQPPFGPNAALKDVRWKAVSAEVIPVVPEKRSVVPDVYNSVEIDFERSFGLDIRVYDDAVAYRFRTSLHGEMAVDGEDLRWTFFAGDTILFPEEQSLLSHYERLYQRRAVASLVDTQFCSLPALVLTASGFRLFLTEADVRDYPGLFLQGSGGGRPVLRGKFPPYVLEEKALNDRNVYPSKEAGYIAATSGTRAFPWRVIGVARTDADLLLNDIVYRLGGECELEETDWILPGKVAWDWWNANNVHGVPFRSGLNTETYRYYIDFASQYGIEYIIFDEGWTRPDDLSSMNPEMNVPALFAYAAAKHVGIIPWVLWNALERDMDRTLDQYAAWGAAGIKVDFMQRHDQRMVNYYETVARKAAERHLLVDFHGAFKPDGLRRRFPNVITREGVRGGEWNKWSADMTPDHNLTLPFTRMAAGPMDYTPGATMNANAKDFRPVFERPMSQGTRCHQLAMYVVYESPLQMLCDNPSNYLRETEMMEFLSIVPTVWDETRVFEAKVGDHVLMARRRGSAWFIGGMTDWTPRSFSLTLDFLGDVSYRLRTWSDGVNADRVGNDFRKDERTIRKGDVLQIDMKPGGGFVAVIEPVRVFLR